MTRRNFVFSWGRKAFFGFSWLLSALITLIYLQSSIHPVGAGQWIYYVTTLIGFTGLFNATLYFLLYCPILAIMPSYYVARFWSMIIIVAANLGLFVDALSFSRYRLHLNIFSLSYLMDEGLNAFLGAAQYSYLAIGLIVFSALVHWIRGERIWRYMQRRFSNPVKNWYLLFIGLCVGLSVLLQTKSFIGNIPQLFPLQTTLQSGVQPSSGGTRDFFYPRSDLKCPGKVSGNLFMIVLNPSPATDENSNIMEMYDHLKSHGSTFKTHETISPSLEGNVFSLLYGIHPRHISSVTRNDLKPALISELDRRGYDKAVFLGKPLPYLPEHKLDIVLPIAADANLKIHEEWKKWLHEKTPGEDTFKPLFSLMVFEPETPVLLDGYLKNLIQDLESKKLLAGSTFVIVHEGKKELVVIWPERDKETFQYVTSNYDVAPSLLKYLWGCKNSFKDSSYGNDLLVKTSTSPFIMTGDEGSLTIKKYPSEAKLKLNLSPEYQIYSFAPDEEHVEFRKEILESLLDLNRFYRSR